MHPYIKALAKSDNIDQEMQGALITSSLPVNSPSPVIPIGNIQFMLNIEIDVTAERERLDKEITRLQNEVAKTQAKLSNPSFVERAPAAVVTQERKRMEDFSSTISQLQIQRGKLG
jgi:valyl-tRNA synthetase